MWTYFINRYVCINMCVRACVPDMVANHLRDYPVCCSHLKHVVICICFNSRLLIGTQSDAARKIVFFSSHHRFVKQDFYLNAAWYLSSLYHLSQGPIATSSLFFFWENCSYFLFLDKLVDYKYYPTIFQYISESLVVTIGRITKTLL